MGQSALKRYGKNSHAKISAPPGSLYTVSMPIFELIVFLLVAAFSWFWMNSIKAREHAVYAATKACAEEDVQLLDETVAIQSFQLARDENGRLRLRRKYAFEFSDTGENRSSGWLVLLGNELETIHLHTSLYLSQ